MVVLTLDEYLDMHDMHDKSQIELARHFDVTQTTVSRWLKRDDVIVEMSEDVRGWSRIFTSVQRKAPD